MDIDGLGPTRHGQESNGDECTINPTISAGKDR
jgi:hypothetical protein